MIHFDLRQARRLVIAVVGATVLLVGLALIVLPGPALIVIPVGLAILGIEFAWARRWLKKARRMAHDALASNPESNSVPSLPTASPPAE